MRLNLALSVRGVGVPALAWLALTMAPGLRAEEVRVVKDATKSCPAPFKESGGKCDIKDEDVVKLSREQCQGVGLAFVGSPQKCEVDRAQAPAPTCSGGALPLAFDRSLGQCVVKSDAVPRSALTEFLGDCYRIRGLPKPSAGAASASVAAASAPAADRLLPDKTYQVRFQRKDGESDRILTLALSNGAGTVGCKPVDEATLFDVKASELLAIGADRAGWAFGVLALPYKFHTDDRSFGSSTSIGPYFGRRWGTPGSAYTFAMAATIGSVKGEVRDAQDKITETPDLQAFSLAAGFTYDIAKTAEVRPFKVGFFVGADWVSASNVVKYKHNRKPWVAFQVGYDFFD